MSCTRTTQAVAIVAGAVGYAKYMRAKGDKSSVEIFDHDASAKVQMDEDRLAVVAMGVVMVVIVVVTFLHSKRQPLALPQQPQPQQQQPQQQNQILSSPCMCDDKITGGVNHSASRPTFDQDHFFPRGDTPASSVTPILSVFSQVAQLQQMTGTMQTNSVTQSLAVGDKGKVGVMICGNSGQPCGEMGQNLQIKAHVPQEEDMMTAMLLATNDCSSIEDGRSRPKMELHKAVVKMVLGQWGLANPRQKDKSAPDWFATIQGVDYANATDPAVYGSAWKLCNVRMLAKDKIGEDGVHDFSAKSHANLVVTFVAGPNAGAARSDVGTTARTVNKICDTRPPNGSRNEAGYKFLKEGTKAAIRAGLLGMINSGCEVALVSGVSTGLYAGAYRRNAGEKEGFPWPMTETLVKEILEENVPGGEKIGRYFSKVLWC